MEKINEFQRIILEALNEYQSQYRLTSKTIKNEILADEKNHHYQFLWTGWQGYRPVFSVVFHIDILDGKIWIQEDKSEVGFANLLVEKGVSKKDIVLAFYPEEHRQFTDFAVA
jgi:XisI protein